MAEDNKNNNDLRKDEIQRLVEIFYQPTFKTFYINSQDGREFIKPSGVFVSLGITTSMNVLGRIRTLLNNSKGYKAELVEIMSEKMSGLFINTITKEENLGDEIIQYDMTEFPRLCMNRDEACEYLDMLKNENLDHTIGEQKRSKNIVYISKMNETIQKLDEMIDGWKDHMIQLDLEEVELSQLF